MRASTGGLQAMIATIKSELTDCLHGLDEAIADCKDARRELEQTVSILDRVERGEIGALSDLRTVVSRSLDNDECCEVSRVCRRRMANARRVR